MEKPHLDRRMGLLQATATNIISMVGVGPFLTIPFMIQAMNGPHILYAWIAGAVLALADGLVYAQLGAALPGSGGGYLYLREAFQPFGLGRLMGFLFIFQTILVAPLSIAGGAVGFSDYLQFVWTTMTPLQHHLLAAVGVRGDDGAPVARHRVHWPPGRGDAGRRAGHRRLGDRGGAVHVLAVDGVRLPAAGVRLRRVARHRARRRLGAGDVQLRRLQPGVQHRRGDHGSRPAPCRDRS